MLLNPKSRTLVVGGKDAATTTVYPLTNWLPTSGVKTARTLLQLSEPSAKFGVTAVYQLAATDTTAPGSWTDIGTELTTESRLTGDVDLTTAVEGDWFIRFGVSAKNSNTTSTFSFERGDVALRVGLST